MESGARRRDARFGDDEKPKEGPPISKTYNHKIPESKYANFQIYVSDAVGGWVHTVVGATGWALPSTQPMCTILCQNQAYRHTP
jgi:hypothetical protein